MVRPGAGGASVGGRYDQPQGKDRDETRHLQELFGGAADVSSGREGREPATELGRVHARRFSCRHSRAYRPRGVTVPTDSRSRRL